MTLRHLEIFCQVCRKESITLAAEKLNMTQPAVSIAIGELESFYGVKLFERMNRRIYITEAGRVLLQYADTVLSQYEESIEVLRRQKTLDRCRISVNVTYAEANLTKKMKQLREKIPSLLWKLFVCNNEQIERKLRENEVDFAVVDKLPAGESWKVIPVQEEIMSVVCAPALPHGKMNWKDLAQKPLLLREWGSGSRKRVEDLFLEAGLQSVPMVESVSSLTLVELAQEGFGYTILPKNQIRQELEQGSLVEVPMEGGKLGRQFYIVYHKNKYCTEIMKKAMRIFAE